MVPASGRSGIATQEQCPSPRASSPSCRRAAAGEAPSPKGTSPHARKKTARPLQEQSSPRPPRVGRRNVDGNGRRVSSAAGEALGQAGLARRRSSRPGRAGNRGSSAGRGAAEIHQGRRRSPGRARGRSSAMRSRTACGVRASRRGRRAKRRESTRVTFASTPEPHAEGDRRTAAAVYSPKPAAAKRPGSRGSTAVLGHDLARRAVQVAAARVVAEARPRREHVVSDPRERSDVGKPRQERVVARPARPPRRLLQHDLGDPDPVRDPRTAPGKRRRFAVEPGEKPAADGDRRRARGQFRTAAVT